MFDYFAKLLESRLGKGMFGLVVCVVIGMLAMWYLPNFVMTADNYDEREEHLIMAMEYGDGRNALDIVQWKIDNTKMEKLKLQNYIDISQRGECTNSQAIRIGELNERIKRLEDEKQGLLKKLEPRR